MFGRGDFEGAVREVDKILAIDPASVEAMDLRSKAEAAKAALVSNIQVEPVPPPPATTTIAATKAPPPPADPGEAFRPQTPTTVKPLPNPREKENADRYARARAALEGGSFAEALDLLNEIQSTEPGYRDTTALMTKAREGQRGLAQKALEDGTRLENGGDWVGAVQQYERAKTLDVSFGGVADESAKRVRARMSVEGAEAYKQGRQADAGGRAADAIPLYERAVRFLPDTDPNKKTARDRLEVLRAKR
jgi:tetratricopeptide (TPR) repeat protein